MNKKEMKKLFRKYPLLITVLAIILVLANWLTGKYAEAPTQPEAYISSLNSVYADMEIPEYTGEPYCIINKNIPFFEEDELTTTEAFETYSELDALNRCGTAYANICKEIMPTEKRGDISRIKPSGWHNNPYDIIEDGGYLYNRCHLIGFQLAGENDNERNLITGTRYMNVEGMLPFENMVDNWVDYTNGHVLYRVTPIYDGNNLVANGVLMEAYSVEDAGDGVCFCVYIYNMQPGVYIDYATGNNWIDADYEKAA